MRYAKRVVGVSGFAVIREASVRKSACGQRDCRDG